MFLNDILHFPNHSQTYLKNLLKIQRITTDNNILLLIVPFGVVSCLRAFLKMVFIKKPIPVCNKMT